MQIKGQKALLVTSLLGTTLLGSYSVAKAATVEVMNKPLYKNGVLIQDAADASVLNMSLTGNNIVFAAGGHLSGATPTLNFNQGDTKIYDNGNLHIATDDDIYLDGKDITTNAFMHLQGLGLSGNVITLAGGGHINGNRPTIDFNQGGSWIKDDGTLRINTDDYLVLQAPTQVQTTGGLLVGKNAQVAGSFTSDGKITANSGIDVTGNLTVSGTTVANGGLSVNLSNGATFYRNDDDQWGGAISIQKTRAGQALKNGDVVGMLSFEADKGPLAFIQSTVSGVNGGNTPADLEFYTTPTTGVPQKQRLVVGTNGNVVVNAADSGTTFLADGGTQINGGLTFGSGKTSPTARTLKIGDYSVDNSNSPTLTIQGSNQTKTGGGNGGNVVINAGTSTSASAGVITIGTVGSTVIAGKLAFTPSSIQSRMTGDTISVDAAVTRVEGVSGVATLKTNGQTITGTAVDGQQLYLIGNNDTNTVVFTAGSTEKLVLGAATRTLGKDDVLHLIYDSNTDRWVEVSFADNTSN